MFSQALIKCAPWQQTVRAVAQEINELLAWLNVSRAVTSSFALVRATDHGTLIHLVNPLAAGVFFLPLRYRCFQELHLERGFNH